MRSRRGGGSRLGPFGNGPLGDDENESQDGQENEIVGKTKSGSSTKVNSDEIAPLVQTAQIEYLIHQSSLGVHFLFSRRDVSRVMMVPTDEKEFFTLKNMERVQKLLTTFLEKPSLHAKERFLNSLSPVERDLMIRAYFHLVENTILSNTDFRH